MAWRRRQWEADRTGAGNRAGRPRNGTVLGEVGKCGVSSQAGSLRAAFTGTTGSFRPVTPPPSHVLSFTGHDWTLFKAQRQISTMSGSSLILGDLKLKIHNKGGDFEFESFHPCKVCFASMNTATHT